jgi:hexosaminidase
LRAATFAADGFELAVPRTQVLSASTLLSRDSSQLVACSNQPESRLDGYPPEHGPRPVYQADIGDMCWLWRHAPLEGIKRVTMTVGRVAWRFGDEATDAVVRTKTSAAGEFELHAGSCAGPLLATLPLAPAAAASGQTELNARISTSNRNAFRNLCIFATGDPRDGQWALARVAFSKN